MSILLSSPFVCDNLARPPMALKNHGEAREPQPHHVPVNTDSGVEVPGCKHLPVSRNPDPHPHFFVFFMITPPWSFV